MMLRMSAVIKSLWNRGFSDGEREADGATVKDKHVFHRKKTSKPGII